MSATRGGPQTGVDTVAHSPAAPGISPATPGTFPGLLLQHASVRGARPAIREKDLGIWQTLTWSQVAHQVRLAAHGLAALGIAPGMHVAVIGENRPQIGRASCRERVCQ